MEAVVPSAGSTMVDRSRARGRTKIDTLASQGGLGTGLTTLSRKRLTVTVTYTIRSHHLENRVSVAKGKD